MTLKKGTVFCGLRESAFDFEQVQYYNPLVLLTTLNMYFCLVQSTMKSELTMKEVIHLVGRQNFWENQHLLSSRYEHTCKYQGARNSWENLTYLLNG